MVLVDQEQVYVPVYYYYYNMDIVINYKDDEFIIYESSSQTVLKSLSLAEGLINLNLFLKSKNLVPQNSDLLNSSDINYHIDSKSMKEIVAGNIKLIKRLKNDQSEFKKSSNRFNGGENGKTKKDFSKGSRNFGKSQFGGSSGFKDSYKKWGNYKSF